MSTQPDLSIPYGTEFSDGEMSDATTSTRTTAISSTDPAFAEQLYQNGILAPADSTPPTNLDSIQELLAMPRSTPPPSISEYRAYVRETSLVTNKSTMMHVGSALVKTYPFPYRRAYDQEFSGVPKDVGFNDGLAAPQPSFVAGPILPEFVKSAAAAADEDFFDGAAIFEDDPASIVTPHVAGEWAVPDEDLSQARVKSSYDGAALVYGRNQALKAIESPDAPGHAKVTTFVTNGARLELYAHHATQMEGGQAQYHQSQISSIDVSGSYQGFQRACREVRNAQDWAKAEAYRLRDELDRVSEVDRVDLVDVTAFAEDEEEDEDM